MEWRNALKCIGCNFPLDDWEIAEEYLWEVYANDVPESVSEKELCDRYVEYCNLYS